VQKKWFLRRWRQQVLPKHWCLPMRLYGVMTETSARLTETSVSASHPPTYQGTDPLFVSPVARNVTPLKYFTPGRRCGVLHICVVKPTPPQSLPFLDDPTGLLYWNAITVKWSPSFSCLNIWSSKIHINAKVPSICLWSAACHMPWTVSPLQSTTVPPGGRWWESDAPDFCCFQIAHI